MDLLHYAIQHLILINDKNERYKYGQAEQSAREDIEDMSNCELLELISRILCKEK